MSRNYKQRRELVATALKGLPAFCITIRDPKEAEYLFDAICLKTFGAKSDQVSKLMHKCCCKYGHEEGPKRFVEESKQLAKQGNSLPEWFAPLLTHIINTADTNLRNENETLGGTDIHGA